MAGAQGAALAIGVSNAGGMGSLPGAMLTPDGLRDEITAITTHPAAGNIFRMDDPELLKYPIAYLSEPGYWFPSEREALGLRQYLQKGGFLIVDDFHFDNEWRVFERAMRQVLPGAKIERLDL